jgi:hypothetical protein
MPPAPDGNRRRKSSGGGWLLLFVLISACGATFFFAGDKLRDFFGIVRKPSAEGTEPTSPGDVKATVVATTPPENTTISNVATHNEAAPTPVAQPVAAIPHEIQFKDQSQGDRYLADAETGFKTLNWTQARSAAEHVLGLDVKPETLNRARDISSKAVVIVDLFKHLSERDELTRNYDTDPSLVAIGQGSHAMLVVPLSSDDQVVTEDPVGYITKMNQVQPGHVPALIKGNKDYIKSELPETLIDLHQIDQVAVNKEKESEFETKLASLNNGTSSRSPLAWYEAAKFAYRNRLDIHVAEMLDQAIELDPLLLKSVRENIAGKLCTAMLFHLRNHSQKPADKYITMIRARYADTDQGKQAELYYTGQTQALLAMAAQEDARRKQAEDERRQARIDRAKELGDSAKVVAIQAEKPVDDTPTEVADSPPANADEQVAKKAFDDGMVLYGKADNMPPTEERNQLYRQAIKFFSASKADYQLLVEKSPNDTSLQEHMVEANQFLFGCHKNLTF